MVEQIQSVPAELRQTVKYALGLTAQFGLSVLAAVPVASLYLNVLWQRGWVAQPGNAFLGERANDTAVAGSWLLSAVLIHCLRHWFNRGRGNRIAARAIGATMAVGLVLLPFFY
jgi:hypothetical protein